MEAEVTKSIGERIAEFKNNALLPVNRTKAKLYAGAIVLASTAVGSLGLAYVGFKENSRLIESTNTLDIVQNPAGAPLKHIIKSTTGELMPLFGQDPGVLNLMAMGFTAGGVIAGALAYMLSRIPRDLKAAPIEPAPSVAPLPASEV